MKREGCPLLDWTKRKRNRKLSYKKENTGKYPSTTTVQSNEIQTLCLTKAVSSVLCQLTHQRLRASRKRKLRVSGAATHGRRWVPARRCLYLSPSFWGSLYYICFNLIRTCSDVHAALMDAAEVGVQVGCVELLNSGALFSWGFRRGTHVWPQSCFQMG